MSASCNYHIQWETKTRRHFPEIEAEVLGRFTGEFYLRDGDLFGKYWDIWSTSAAIKYRNIWRYRSGQYLGGRVILHCWPRWASKPQRQELTALIIYPQIFYTHRHTHTPGLSDGVASRPSPLLGFLGFPVATQRLLNDDPVRPGFSFNPHLKAIFLLIQSHSSTAAGDRRVAHSTPLLSTPLLCPFTILICKCARLYWGLVLCVCQFQACFAAPFLVECKGKRMWTDRSDNQRINRDWFD